MDINDNAVYTTAMNYMTDRLRENNIEYVVHPCYSGYQLTFKGVNYADIVCHEGSYGGKLGQWESFGFPWDFDDVTGYLTAEEFIKMFKENFPNLLTNPE